MFSSKEQAKKRYEICKSCEDFSPIKTCKKCGCFMPAKVRIANASCPVRKWEESTIDIHVKSVYDVEE